MDITLLFDNATSDILINCLPGKFDYSEMIYNKKVPQYTHWELQLPEAIQTHKTYYFQIFGGISTQSNKV